MSDTVQMLRLVPIFADLDDEALNQLAAKCRRLTFKKNTVIMPEGEPGECLYIIESGSTRVFVGDADGREIVLFEEGPGSYIGDVSLLDDAPRSASVITLEKTSVLSVSKKDFLHCILNNPSISLSIMRSLTRRLRRATDGIRSLALDNVYRRLANKLVEMSEQLPTGEVALCKRYSHQDLGNMIGASREMVGKVMAELIKGEYIEMRDRTIYIMKSLPRNW